MTEPGQNQAYACIIVPVEKGVPHVMDRLQEMGYEARKVLGPFNIIATVNYETEDKMLAIVGADASPELFEFQRSKIPVKQRVMVQEDSLLIHYRSALVEEANEISSRGGFGNMITDASAREKYMRAIRDPKLGGPLTPEQVQKEYIDELHFRIIHKGEMQQVEPWWDLNAHREAAQLRLLRESLRWDEDTKQRFMQFWMSLEQAQAKIVAEAEQKKMEDAQKQIRLQAQMLDEEAKAKAKVELLRGTTKLAVESMKEGGNGAGAGAGAAALMSQVPMNGSEQGESENG